MDLTNQIQEILTKAGNYIHGRDSEQTHHAYESIAEWKHECGMATTTTSSATTTTTPPTTNASEEGSNRQQQQQQQQQEGTRQQWYKTGYDYWENSATCPATIDGMLGGFARLSKKDLEGSAEFVRHLKANIRPELRLTTAARDENNDDDDDDGSSLLPTRACECGAGIGRVSKGLLLPLLGIDRCDLVEPSPRLVAAAPDYLGDECSGKCRYFCTGLQDFEPRARFYDIIWIQWVIGYLTDDDLLSFFKRCGEGLRKGGVIVVKDNTCEEEAFIVDRDDASSTRSLPYILAIAELAGLRVVYQRFQENFPDNIFPVPMIALEPKT